MLSNRLTAVLLASSFASAVATQACIDPNYGTSLGSANDTVHTSQAIGFAFPMDGATYTDIHISYHGVCWLSNGGTPAPATSGATTYNVLLTDFVAFGPCIAPFWADANCGYAPTPSGNVGEVFINNSDPTRCVVTWAGMWTYQNVGPQYTVQMALNISGEVEFLYGPNVDNYGSTFAPNAIVGITPGQAAALPAASDLSTQPVTTDPSVFEEFTAPGTFDMSADGFRFIPTSPGWIVLTLGGSAGCAEVATFGEGCIRNDAMFYEDMAVGAFDLTGVTLSMLRTPTGYTCVDTISGAFLTPSPTAQIVADADEIEETVTLSAAMPIPGGTTTDLTVESNGRITLGPAGGGPDWSPTVNELQALTAPTIAPYWHDMNPNATGSGKITFEEVGGIAYVTWDNVWSCGTTTGSTFQVQLNLTTGDVTTVYSASSGVGNNTLVGFNSGTSTEIPPTKDLSADLAASFLVYDSEGLPLRLSGDLPRLGTNWTLTASNVDPISPIGLFVLGSSQGPGLPLQAIGINAPGCSVWIDVLLGSFVSPAVAGVASGALPVPNNPALTGATLSAQAVSLTLNNSGNLLTSNGALGTLGL